MQEGGSITEYIDSFNKIILDVYNASTIATPTNQTT